MNSIDSKPNYKKLYTILVDVFEKIGYFNYGYHDETLCSMRVYETAKEIIKKVDSPVNEVTILTAAVIHDIGKSNIDVELVSQTEITDELRAEWVSHEKKSVPLAREVLEKEGHSQEFIEEVCFLIGHHNKCTDGLSERSMELQILQDADIVADCGMVDLIRCISYGAIHKRPVINSIQYLKSSINRVHQDDKLNLDVSKELVSKKLAAYQPALDEFYELINSELLEK